MTSYLLTYYFHLAILALLLTASRCYYTANSFNCLFCLCLTLFIVRFCIALPFVFSVPISFIKVVARLKKAEGGEEGGERAGGQLSQTESV